jgi:serine/threonine-protein kinase
MLVGQRLLGTLEIEKELGSGAMGAVYQAVYIKTGAKVAVKVITPGLGASEQALARFEREVEVLKQLTHPNIVRFYKNGRYKGSPFYVMEYIDGESLDRALARRGRFTWEEVVELGKQVCSALKHAHDQGIIHRDLKPSNLMVTSDGRVKLTDFGIAKDLDVTQLTAANCTVGTAAYMSPEQCKGERNLTHKSDLYSLGILFYELVTGEKPFKAETTMDMFLLHVQGKPERPSRLALDIPPWFDTLILGLLEKKPEHRPFDATAVAEQLERIQEKAAAQKSAGVDAAERLAAGPPRDASADETDRKAARTLLGGGRHKRRRRKHRKFYQKVWFQAAVMGGLLLAIVGFLLYLFLIPPSAEKLYAEAEKLVNSGNPDDQLRARSESGPIKRYLRYYGDRDDPQTLKVRKWADDVEVQDRSERLRGLLESKKGQRTIRIEPDNDEERLALRAASAQDDGDLSQARELWVRLAKSKDETDVEKRSWGLLADRKLRDLRQDEAARDNYLGQLERQRDEIYRTGKEPRMATEAEDLALKALRYERFNDIVGARQCWEKLKLKHGKNPGNRTLVQLAMKKLKELRTGTFSEEQEKADRREHLQRILKEAATWVDDNPGKTAVYCREMIALYKDDKDLEKEVKEAEELLKKATPPPKPEQP